MIQPHGRRSILGLGLALGLALAACGGKAATGTTPQPRGDLPFDPATVQAALTTRPIEGTDGCAVEGAATVGDAMRLQRDLLASDGKVDEAFTCRKSDLSADTWECTWEVARAPGGGEEDEGTAFQAIVQVDHTGAIEPGQLVCIAPG